MDDNFYKFRFFGSEKIYLIDLLLISLMIMVIDFNLYPEKVKANNYGLIPDTSNLKIENDNLFRNKQVKEVVKIIETTAPNQAISISIVSDWGHGKSSFMKFVSDELTKQKNVIQIHFNPWLSKHSKPVIHLFFEQLFDELEKFDPRIANKIYKYSNDVLTSSTDYGMIEKIAKTIVNMAVPSHYNNSIQNQKIAINNRISALNKKIVVCIDDLDRISGEEIMDIFSLIKNTIDFKNTFFLVSLDLGYTKSTLKSYNELLDVNRYLEKIFQLQILLTPIIFEEIPRILKLEIRKLIDNNIEVLNYYVNENISQLVNENGSLDIKKISFLSQFDSCIDQISYYSLNIRACLGIKFG